MARYATSEATAVPGGRNGCSSSSIPASNTPRPAGTWVTTPMSCATRNNERKPARER